MPYFSVDVGTNGRRAAEAEHAGAALDGILGKGVWRWLPYTRYHGARAIVLGSPGHSKIYSVRRITRRGYDYIRNAG